MILAAAGQNFIVVKEIVLILLVSMPILFLFRKLKISSIVGFLFTGILIGPFGFKLITSIDEVNVMAEIGVILLLFTIGLEFSIKKLFEMRKLLLIAGGSQMLLTTAVSAGLFLAFSIPVTTAIFLGIIISFSSTAIVLKILSERNELTTPYGSISVAILLLQDMAIVPLLILLPVLGATGDVSVLEIGGKIGLAFALVAVIIVTARFLVPKLLYYFAVTRMREIFTIGIVLIVLGVAFLTELIGLSLSIGAFIAGIIISESEFSHQTVAEIVPFKDVFNSIFFVSIGMLMNLTFLTENVLMIVLTALAIVVMKSLIILGIVKMMKYPARVGMLAGLTLAQIGEFSFLIAQAGMGYDLMPSDYFNVFLAASIITMTATPFLIQGAPFIADKLNILDKAAAKRKDTEPSELKKHVIIVGFGLNGKNLVTVLKETGIPHVIIELNPKTVMECKSQGENIMYGDITKREILHLAGVEKAKVIVFAISDPRSTETGLKIAKEENPGIYAVVRTRFVNEVDALLKMGADEVIPEEFETSLQIFSKVLLNYHIPINIVLKQMNILRSNAYNILRKEGDPKHQLAHLDEILAQGLTETFYVSDENPHSGKSLMQLDIRARTGATIIALIREGHTKPNPAGNDTLEKGDTIVIYGTHDAVDTAIRYLNGDAVPVVPPRDLGNGNINSS